MNTTQCLEWNLDRKYWCGLPVGHEGDHRAKNENGYPEPFDVRWPRDACPRCGQRLPKVSVPDEETDA